MTPPASKQQLPSSSSETLEAKLESPSQIGYCRRENSMWHRRQAGSAFAWKASSRRICYRGPQCQKDGRRDPAASEGTTQRGGALRQHVHLGTPLCQHDTMSSHPFHKAHQSPLATVCSGHKMGFNTSYGDPPQ